jgi:ectoine hydroxylase-related dioxygenase (phytanoyl-CoA dioxygenase family)
MGGERECGVESPRSTIPEGWMEICEALRELGVGPDVLTAEERSRLECDGYLALPGLIPAHLLEQMRSRVDALVATEGQEAGKEVHQETGTNRLSDLVNKVPMFDVCFTHPRLLAGIAHVLRGDLKLSSLNFRAALPGHGLQQLHADWSGAVRPGEYFVCNSIWLLDDFTPDNGATRVVPGSQRSGRVPRDEMVEPAQPHPREVLVTGPAGTVVIFNSHTWHGGTLNRTDRPRRALHSYFCRRDQPQQLDQRRYVRPETLARLSPAARCILDVL